MLNTLRQEGLRSGKDVLGFYTVILILLLDPDAIKLAKELDGLPLILATARVYLNQVVTSYSNYLRLYKEL